MRTPNPAAHGEEVERLIAQMQGVESASAEAQRLVRLVMSLHGAALSRLLALVRGTGGGEALLRQVASDPLVASVLALHDLEPRPRDEQLLQIVRSSGVEGHGEGPSRDEKCELCAAAVPEAHDHLVDIETRRLLCACAMCRTVGGKYRLVPSRYLHHPSMTLASAEWAPLGIPVGLVFFVVNSHVGRTVVSYPGPAGATESLLPLETWPALTERHTWLQQLAPDVEALLVRRTGDDYRCFIVPLDACYVLVGRIRKSWTGFGGGEAVNREIDQFFVGLLRKAQQRVEVVA